MVESKHNLTENPKRTRRCFCLLCTLGTILVLITLIVILIFTVFKVKNPIMTINAIRLGTGNAGGLVLGSNINMTVDTSVKNPNVGTFKFSNTTCSIFYDGIMVGQGNVPPGVAHARKSVRMNVTVDLVTAKLMKAPRLSSDLGSGLFTMDSYTVAPGKVKLIIKKSVVVKMNCTVTFNVTSQVIKEQKCTSHVEF